MKTACWKKLSDDEESNTKATNHPEPNRNRIGSGWLTAFVFDSSSFGFHLVSKNAVLICYSTLRYYLAKRDPLHCTAQQGEPVF